MIYKVTKRFQRGSETPIGTFKTLNEAKTYIQEKLADDAMHKVDATYGLHEGMDLLEEFDQTKLAQQPDAQSQGGGQQQGSGQTFSPTPFNMTPQPKGLPRSWVKDDEKKDSNEKEGNK